MIQPLTIKDKTFNSRLFLGTGKFHANSVMQQAIEASESELVTVALKRLNLKEVNDDLLKHIQCAGVHLLPNTSGVRTAKEAIFAAELAREALGTNWLKLEIHPDPRYLLPDPLETLNAAEALVKKGFVVLPYIQADPVLCKRLEDVGVAALMPLGAPIGSNQGLQTRTMIAIIVEQSNVPVIVDAGLGAPSHAAEALEMGVDAVLVNTAIAVAGDPVRMALAFKLAVTAGRIAFEAKLGKISKIAQESSPLTAFLGKSA
ncbi:thiazole synthase [Deltaproteobacteria bacterium TL4]